MSHEQTLSIIKPDAVADNKIGEIFCYFEKAGLEIVGIKMQRLTVEQAKAFYAVHAHRPFFQELIKFMTEGPIVAFVVEGENAINHTRELMGATNPKEAALGTIRKTFGASIERNAIHGSDTSENAKTEISFFFQPQAIFIH
ncbi:MAG TPA: nucleoside-diphosphate kinase [Candidatus Rhabdochlamydia sp.]|jgi:nucleoside-diphosphate kinase|nr:nucleoside-diphosphate kinase [Candidatus Rhabdochlamydia sp.]